MTITYSLFKNLTGDVLLVSVGVDAFWSLKWISLTNELGVILGLFVKLYPFLVFIGYIHVRENGFYRAFVHAGITINASLWVNVKPVG